MSALPLFLGVDAGGTHTRAAVADEQGRLRGAGRAGRGKVEREAETAAGAVREAADQALSEAGIAWDGLEGACVAAAGLDHDWQFPLLGQALARCGLPAARLENDALAAWAGGTGGLPGAVAIAGTGHNVLAVDAAGRRCWQADLGEINRFIALPRPGWMVGWTALGLGLAAPEGSPLHQGTLAYLGVADTGAAMDALRAEGAAPGRDAAAMAAAAAAAGDPLATLLLRAAGAAIGANAVLALRALGMDRDPCPVAHVGGLFQAPDLRQAFTEVVGAACPRVRVGPPALPPVLGAVLLAMEGSGAAADARTLAALAEAARAGEL